MCFFSRSRPLGERGERAAVAHLRRAGYCIVQRNARIGKYEIDIIVRDGDTVAFVEVKTRRSTDIAEPIENVTATKRRHIRHAAHRYVAERNHGGEYYRFDVVAVVIPESGKPEITHYPDAFSDE